MRDETSLPAARVLRLEVRISGDEAGGEVLAQRRLAKGGADVAANRGRSEQGVLCAESEGAEGSELVVAVDRAPAVADSFEVVDASSAKAAWSWRVTLKLEAPAKLPPNC